MAEAGPALVQTRGMGRDYAMGAGLVHALDHLDLDIHAGEYLAITGPSGSGKSTCLHLLAGLQRPSRGSYHFDGTDVGAMDDRALAQLRNRDVGLVFQAFHLLPRASALDNVALPLAYARTPAAERHSQAADALARVGLADRAAHRPSELSGGQQQRVAVARAVVRQPRLLLADEPTGALDRQQGAAILDLLEDLHRAGTTLVVVTHDPQVAARAHRVLRMQDGQLVGDGPP